jgi:hypothetical protein
MTGDDPMRRQGVHISGIADEVVGTGDALLLRFLSPDGTAQDVFFELPAAEKLMAVLQEALVQTYAQRASEGGLARPPTNPPRRETLRTFRVGHSPAAEAAVLELVTNEDRPLLLTAPKAAATELSRQLAATVARLTGARSGGRPPKPRKPN